MSEWILSFVDADWNEHGGVRTATLTNSYTQTYTNSAVVGVCGGFASFIKCIWNVKANKFYLTLNYKLIGITI